VTCRTETGIDTLVFHPVIVAIGRVHDYSFYNYIPHYMGSENGKVKEADRHIVLE
jgi:hypothetical protein